MLYLLAYLAGVASAFAALAGFAAWAFRSLDEEPIEHFPAERRAR